MALAGLIGGEATILWHPNGCDSDEGVIQLANPGSVVTSPDCISNDFDWPTGTPAGGWQIQNMPPNLSFEIRQGPRDGEVCGLQLIQQPQNDGCYNLPNLADKVWWRWCETGLTCSELVGTEPQARSAEEDEDIRPTSTLKSDDEGEYMMAGNGQRIPVCRQEDVSEPMLSDTTLLRKRQSTTYEPPEDCFRSVATCNSYAELGVIEVDCINCIHGVGVGQRASATIDCRASTSDCPVAVSESITVTDTVWEEVGFGVEEGFSGEMDGVGTSTSVGFQFSWGHSFSVATERGQTLTLNIPAGNVGFLQYQPPALLGTVASALEGTAESVNGGGSLCDGNKLCRTTVGVITSENNDQNGQYSVVVTS